MAEHICIGCGDQLKCIRFRKGNILLRAFLADILRLDADLYTFDFNISNNITFKLDGSNMCVGSNGLVASRRKIILQNPSDEDLNKSKFCGMPLGQYMSSSLKNTSKCFIANKMADI